MVSPRPGPRPVAPPKPTEPPKPVEPAEPEISKSVSLSDCRPHDSPFGRLVREVAAKKRVEPRALAVRTLLHLPRVAGYRGKVTWRQIDAELHRCAAGLLVDQAKVQRLMPTGNFELKQLKFVADYNSADAAEIFTNLHYLRNARPGSINYALVDPIYGQPISLCSVSPLEWQRVGRQLSTQFDVPMEAVWDISRVYSFDVAPANAISFLLAKVRNDLRQRVPAAQLLSTAVDPNLGFTGTSYLAANWQRWMTIKARPYLYYKSGYVSPRQLRTLFQTTNLDDLRAMHGDKFKQSRTVLLDSMIFCARIKGETEFVPEESQRRLNR